MSHFTDKRAKDLEVLADKLRDIMERRVMDAEDTLRSLTDSAAEYAHEAATEAQALSYAYDRAHRSEVIQEQPEADTNDIPFMHREERAWQ